GRDSDRARDHLPDGRGSKRLGRLEHHLSRDPSAQVADWIARRHSALAAHSCRDLARAQRWPLIRDAEPGGDVLATWTRLLLPRLEIPRPISSTRYSGLHEVISGPSSLGLSKSAGSQLSCSNSVSSPAH